ncbi:MAG: hypothetical protein ABIL58_20160 [Pseudomonadota bacterium]
MGKVTRPKTVYYKRAMGLKRGVTLQAMLQSAFQKKNKPSLRQETLDEEGNNFRFINEVRPMHKMLFGQLIYFEKGKLPAGFVLDPNATEYHLETIPVARSEDGKKRELLESILYFGSFENHLLLLQSMSLRARDFEKHITWLLSKHTGILPATRHILLSDEPTPAAKKKIEASPIKTIRLGSPLVTVADDKPVKGQSPVRNKMKFRPHGQGFDILEAVLGDEWRQKLKLEDSLDDANLWVNLEITYLRKTTEDAQRVLQNLATSMRHAEAEDLEIQLKDGGTIKGDELKLAGKIKADVYDGGIIDSNSLYIEMWDWMRTKIEERVI